MTNHICIFVLSNAPTCTDKTANTNGRLNRSTASERLLLWWFDIVCQQARTLASSTRSLSPHNHHAVHHIIIFIMRARVSYRSLCFSIGQHTPASHQPPFLASLIPVFHLPLPPPMFNFVQKGGRNALFSLSSEKKLSKRLAVSRSRRTFAAANERSTPLRRRGSSLRSLASREKEFFERLANKTK